MIKKLFVSAFFAAACAVCALAGSLAASATTVEDVMAEARKYGYPENTIQDGYNYYLQNPGAYDSDDFDMAIAKIRQAGGSLITTGPQQAAPVITTTTTAAVTTAAVTQTDKTGAVVTSPAKPAEPEKKKTITLTAPDGATFERISAEDFIKLSYEEKNAYIASFPPEYQQVIIDNLSPEEYRSLLKQLPSEQKLEVVNDLSEAVKAMGMNLTVEEIADDSLSVAMRNDDGEIISVSNAGVIVEDTGYDRTKIYLAAGAILLAAAIATALAVKFGFGKKSTGVQNER